MDKKKGAQTIKQMEKQLQQKQGVVDAIKTVQDFQKSQIMPKEDRQTKFSRYSKGTWESYSYSSQK